MTSRPNPFAKQWKQFKANTQDHKLTYLQEDGLYRHIRMQAPGTGIWHWDLITWPGHLCFDGDIGLSLVFSRDLDMMEFFRHGVRLNYYADGAPSFDPTYWAQKLGQGSQFVKEFSHDVFYSVVQDSLEAGFDPGTRVNLLEQAVGFVDDEDGARSWLDSTYPFCDMDTWEWDLTSWNHHYILACYAIIATVTHPTYVGE